MNTVYGFLPFHNTDDEENAYLFDTYVTTVEYLADYNIVEFDWYYNIDFDAIDEGSGWSRSGYTFLEWNTYWYDSLDGLYDYDDSDGIASGTPVVANGLWLDCGCDGSFDYTVSPYAGGDVALTGHKKCAFEPIDCTTNPTGVYEACFWFNVELSPTLYKFSDEYTYTSYYDRYKDEYGTNRAEQILERMLGGGLFSGLDCAGYDRGEASGGLEPYRWLPSCLVKLQGKIVAEDLDSEYEEICDDVTLAPSGLPPHLTKWEKNTNGTDLPCGNDNCGSDDSSGGEDNDGDGDIDDYDSGNGGDGSGDDDDNLGSQEDLEQMRKDVKSTGNIYD